MTASTLTDPNIIACPKCGGQMYDNRATKKSAKQPDFKCKNYRVCDGVIWPAKGKVADITPITPLQGPAVEKPKLTKLYQDATEFVLGSILPLYTKAGIGCSDTAIVAAVATLYISATKER